MEKIGNINNFAGAVLSLNQKMSPYFGIGMSRSGKSKVWFSISEWCHRIPEGLTDAEAAQVQNAISTGLLVNGRVYLPKAVKDEAVLDKYISTMKRALTLDQKSKDVFLTLIRKTHEGNYTSKEIMLACLEDEKINKRRGPWIAFLEEGIKYYKGPDTLITDYSDYQESLEYVAEAPVEAPRPQANAKSKPGRPSKQDAPKLTDKQKEDLLTKHLGEKI